MACFSYGKRNRYTVSTRLSGLGQATVIRRGGKLIALLQRVTEASVTVDSRVIGAIGPGLLVFLAVQPLDAEADALRLIERLATYRVFADSEERMNLSLADTGGEMLLVSQFTLAADTRKGLRPSFTTAAPPELGERLFERRR